MRTGSYLCVGEDKRRLKVEMFRLVLTGKTDSGRTVIFYISSRRVDVKLTP